MLEILQERVQSLLEDKIVVADYHLDKEKIVCESYTIVSSGHCVNTYAN